jgi:cbb3-type cytochrome oxidase maturation protein
MYFPYFIAYITIGLIIGVTVFFWALRNGQFQDQQRARFLPLEREGKTAGRAVGSGWKRYEVYLLFFLACAGLISSGAVLIFALMAGGR